MGGSSEHAALWLERKAREVGADLSNVTTSDIRSFAQGQVGRLLLFAISQSEEAAKHSRIREAVTGWHEILEAEKAKAQVCLRNLPRKRQQLTELSAELDRRLSSAQNRQLGNSQQEDATSASAHQQDRGGVQLQLRDSNGSRSVPTLAGHPGEDADVASRQPSGEDQLVTMEFSRRTTQAMGERRMALSLFSHKLQQGLGPMLDAARDDLSSSRDLLRRPKDSTAQQDKELVRLWLSQVSLSPIAPSTAERTMDASAANIVSKTEPGAHDAGGTAWADGRRRGPIGHEELRAAATQMRVLAQGLKQAGAMKQGLVDALAALAREETARLTQLADLNAMGGGPGRGGQAGSKRADRVGDSFNGVCLQLHHARAECRRLEAELEAVLGAAFGPRSGTSGAPNGAVSASSAARTESMGQGECEGKENEAATYRGNSGAGIQGTGGARVSRDAVELIVGGIRAEAALKFLSAQVRVLWGELERRKAKLGEVQELRARVEELHKSRVAIWEEFEAVTVINQWYSARWRATKADRRNSEPPGPLARLLGSVAALIQRLGGCQGLLEEEIKGTLALPLGTLPPAPLGIRHPQATKLHGSWSVGEAAWKHPADDRAALLMAARAVAGEAQAVPALHWWTEADLASRCIAPDGHCTADALLRIPGTLSRQFTACAQILADLRQAQQAAAPATGRFSLVFGARQDGAEAKALLEGLLGAVGAQRHAASGIKGTGTDFSRVIEESESDLVSFQLTAEEASRKLRQQSARAKLASEQSKQVLTAAMEDWLRQPAPFALPWVLKNGVTAKQCLEAALADRND